jgi:hypothetical protein
VKERIRKKGRRREILKKEVDRNEKRRQKKKI